MTTKYLVRKTEICPVCKGARFLSNPEWEEINQTHDAWMKEHTRGRFTDPAVEDWKRPAE